MQYCFFSRPRRPSASGLMLRLRSALLRSTLSNVEGFGLQTCVRYRSASLASLNILKLLFLTLFIIQAVPGISGITVQPGGEQFGGDLVEKPGRVLSFGKSEGPALDGIT